MGRLILAALLGGILVVGVSTALAEEPQPSAQEVLKAWGQAQMEVDQISKPSTLEGKQLLTDEDLEQVSAGGWGWSAITNQSGIYSIIGPRGLLTKTKQGKTFGVIVDYSVVGKLQIQ